MKVSLRKRRPSRSKRFYVRCLPADFPDYDFSRRRQGGPRLFVVQMAPQYVAIFNRDGVPVYWYKAGGEPDNAQVLPDGTLAFVPVDNITFQTGDYQIRTLTGRLLRRIRARRGTVTDVHELELLPNGNFLVGAQEEQDHFDITAHGGSKDSTIIAFEIQEITPRGRVVWRWDSGRPIGVDETPERWWRSSPFLTKDPYDTQHWNSADVKGKFMLLSFRHLDAVYEINRRTGKIVWKLGGTTTTRSLRVRDRQHPDYLLGGQHDVRYAPNGTITIYDNRSELRQPPRVVRYKIDRERRTARLLKSFGEPRVSDSFCCGSARLLRSRDWLVNWGGQPLVGAYNRRGRRIFLLNIGRGRFSFSYRANPVPRGAVTTRRLRRAMNRMAR